MSVGYVLQRLLTYKDPDMTTFRLLYNLEVGCNVIMTFFVNATFVFFMLGSNRYVVLIRHYISLYVYPFYCLHMFG